ncbi:MAG: putative Ig domain-containing protein, partial [Gemmataceae bacterium]|nr:putative Ig domain-containing protein [Gemmataceae bacterium]
VYGTATLRWTPTTADFGQYAAVFTVTDGGNGNPANAASTSRPVRIAVRAANQAPTLDPVGTQTVAEGDTLSLRLFGNDPDGDPLTYTATGLPAGATLDPATGMLTWTPSFFQAGEYPGVTVRATDGDLTAARPFTVRVTNTNQAPVLAPFPNQRAREGTELQFVLQAGDIDGDTLTYSATSLPAGATFDPQTRQFRWTPGFEQAGQYTASFRVSDGALTDEIEVPILVDNVNRAPALVAFHRGAVAGTPLAFNLSGTDPDLNTTLTYSAIGLPLGATLDPNTGAFAWTPGPTQLGDQVIAFSVTDGDAVTSKSVVVRVTVAPVPPAVSVIVTPSFPVAPNRQVLLQSTASSLAPITSVLLKVNGQTLTTDAQGRAYFTPTAPGRYTVEATATDADGYANTVQKVLKVRDPADTAAPVVQLDQRFSYQRLTAASPIAGSVSDTNLDVWTLELAAAGSTEFAVVASGTGPATGTLWTLDPTRLTNGFYQLRLTATDIGGRSAVATLMVEAGATAKPGQYLATHTDLTVPTGAGLVSITRTYDSLDRDRAGLLGYGWRLATREFRVEAGVPFTGREGQGVYEPFRVGTRVYVTLPDGRRVGFTFAPVAQTIPGLTYYLPAWAAESGVQWQLASANTPLRLAGGRLFDLTTGRPYNPGSGQFGPDEYTLTAPTGVRYQLSTANGLEVQTNLDGTRLYFGDNGIAASTGEQIRFTTDEAGRLASVTAPDGTQVVYAYDALGNLTAARNLTFGLSARYGYAPLDAHLLTTAFSPLGGTAVTYGPTVQTVPLTGDLGGSGQFATAPVSGTLAAGATDRYAIGLRPSELQSTPLKTVFLAVSVEATAGSALQPAVPVIAGLTPQLVRTGTGTAFAVFAVTREGLYAVEVTGAGGAAGGYRLSVKILGDVNGDGSVNGVDGQLLSAALGTSAGQPGYSPDADLNRDGAVNALDQSLQAGNFGFAPNRAPVIAPTTVLTHVDLPATTPLSQLVTDPEDDRTYFRVVGLSNGTATLSADGRSLTYTPTPGFSGAGAVQVVADDGYGSSAPTAVTFTVSNAPLVNLNLSTRKIRMRVGDHAEVEVLGDFADQKGVSLPLSYLTVSTTNPAVAAFDHGHLEGVAVGMAVLEVSRGSILTATAVQVGTATQETPALLARIGMDVYPDAIVLPEGAPGRQIVVSLRGIGDLTAASAGTRYYTSNPAVATVTAEGVLTPTGVGETTLVVINSGAEQVVPVKVVTPRTGPVVLGAGGGVVRGVDGTLVQIPPGALSGDQTVGVTRVPQSALPAPVPSFLQFAAAIQLDMPQSNNRPLSQPLQLAFPVDPTLAPGTTLILYQYNEIPGPNGVMRPIWLQVDTAVVGADHMARTTSPPYPSVWQTRGMIIAGVATAALGVVALKMLTTLSVPAIAAISVGVGVAAVLIGAAYIGAQLYMHAPAGQHTVEVIAIPPTGVPESTTTTINVNPGATNSFETTIPDPKPSSAYAPVINSLKVVFEGGKSLLEITGDKFGTVGGTEVDVILEEGYDQKVLTGSQVQRLSATTLRIEIPKDVTLGLAEVFVTRRQMIWGVEDISNGARLDMKGVYGFQVMADERVVVFDNAKMVIPGTPAADALVTSIPLQTGGATRAFRVAATKDNTRAYVTLRYGAVPGVAVLDAAALHQLDADPETPQTDIIPLDGHPYDIALDEVHDYAFVSDWLAGSIWVIDINPYSEHYNQPIAAWSFPQAERGFSELAVSADGTQLVVAVNGPPGYGSQPDGKLLVIDIDPTNRLPGGGGTWGSVIQTINTGKAPYGVQAAQTLADGTQVIGITNFKEAGRNSTVEPRSYGYISRSPGSKTWNAPVFLNSEDPRNELKLGFSNDSFDVTSARSLAFTADGEYAFVLGWAVPNVSYSVGGFPFYEVTVNGDLSTDHGERHNSPYPAGSSIGIIKDPFGRHGAPDLIAGLRPIPLGFPQDIAVGRNGDREYLYASYNAPGSGRGGMFVYDIGAIRTEIAASTGKTDTFRGQTVSRMGRHPLNDLVGGQSGGHNPAIDVRAAYAFTPDQTGAAGGTFEVYDSSRAPVRLGNDFATGIAVQNGPARDFPTYSGPGVLVIDSTGLQSTDGDGGYEWTYADRGWPTPVEAFVRQNRQARGLTVPAEQPKWTMTATISEDDGLVLSDVRLGGRLLAESMSVPYFTLQTGNFTEQRLELVPDGDSPTRGNDSFGQDRSGRVRLVGFKAEVLDVVVNHEHGTGNFVEHTEKKLVVSATYVVDRIDRTRPYNGPSDPGSSSALLITQRYEFDEEHYPAANATVSSPVTGLFPTLLPPHGDDHANEPSGTAFGAKFRPIVEYQFLPDHPDEEFRHRPATDNAPNATYFEVNIPQRLHFTVAHPETGDETSNVVNFTYDLEPDKNKVLTAILGVDGGSVYPNLTTAVIPTWGSPSSQGIIYDYLDYKPANPMAKEIYERGIRRGDAVQSLGLGGTAKGFSSDNFHQSAGEFVDLPWVGWVPDKPAGAPDAVHIHWRWNHLVSPGLGYQSSFGAGDPLKPFGSDQDLNIAVVSYATGEDDPNAFTDLVSGGVNPDSPVQDYDAADPLDMPVFWWQGTGYQRSDKFFSSGGFFASEYQAGVPTYKIPKFSALPNPLRAAGTAPGVRAGEVVTPEDVGPLVAEAVRR